MPGATRTSIDSAGGVELSPPQGFVYVEGQLWTVQGTPVSPHGVGLHAAPVMVGHSNLTFINGIGVCRAGDLANCGHAATGSSVVFSN